MPYLLDMNKNIHFHFVSIYYKDIHHFISEVFEFVRDFFEIVENKEHFHDQKKFEKLSVNEIHLHQTTPIFLTPLPLSYLINSYETEDELMERIEKDVMELHSKMNKSNQTIDLTLTTELMDPIENKTELQFEQPKNYYFVFQVNSKKYRSEKEFREKIKFYIDNYFINYKQFPQLKYEDLTDSKKGIKYEGDLVSFSEKNRYLVYDLSFYPSASKHYQNVLKLLDEIKTENLPKNNPIIVQLCYKMLPF